MMEFPKLDKQARRNGNETCVGIDLGGNLCRHLDSGSVLLGRQEEPEGTLPPEPVQTAPADRTEAVQTVPVETVWTERCFCRC